MNKKFHKILAGDTLILKFQSLYKSFFHTVFLLFVLSTVFLTVMPSHASSPEDDFGVFMWVGAQQLMDKDPEVLENMLLFSRRNNIIPYSSGMHEPQRLESFLKTCKKLDIPRTWIEIGPGKEHTVKAFVEDPSARKPILDRFRKLAKIYKTYYPSFARITLFDEAPLGAFGTKDENGGGYTHQLKRFKEYGPQAYAFLQEAIKGEMPNAEVGIFLHHPHNASGKMAGKYSLIGEFMRKCEDAGQVPDFIFSDVYRGYFNRGYGNEPTDGYITDVVDHTVEVGEKYGIEAYQLGQMHTIKLGYTPSRYQIDRNIEAMLKGKPDGIGWYWPNYASTNYERQTGDGIGKPTGYDVSFDPFVPNAWGKIGPAGSVYGTSKDRFVYSYLRMLERRGTIDADSHFDLWLYGYDFDHAEHTLYLKTNAEHGSQWEMIGHFNPQQDKDAYEEGAREQYIYSYNDEWHAVAFHALSRDKFLNEGEGSHQELELKMESSGESDGSEFSAAYIMPHRETRNYVTLKEITRFIEDHPRWVRINSISAYVRPMSLKLKQDAPVEIQIK